MKQSFLLATAYRFLIPLCGTALLAASFLVANAASGDADLSISLSESDLSPGDETIATIRLDSSELILAGDEEISTASVYLQFPPTKLEVVGAIDFSATAFPMPYVGRVDNEAGEVEIIRARDPDTAFAENAVIASITFRAVADSPEGDADIEFVSGLNNILLNDIANTDVVGALSGNTIVVSSGGGGTSTPTPSPASSTTPTPTFSATPPFTPAPSAAPESDDSSGSAKIWITLDDPDIYPGQSTTGSIRLDTGGMPVSSVEAVFDYPSDFIEIQGESIDVSGSSFTSVATNSNSISDGRLELALFNNPPITSSNALLGTFEIVRLDPIESAITLLISSGAYLDDINNTNVLSLADSFGVSFAEAEGPRVDASLSKNSITTNGKVIVTFKSVATGSYAIRKDSCESYSTLGQGQVMVADKTMTREFSGSQIGMGADQKLVICVTDDFGATGRSNLLSINVTQGHTSGAKVQFCGITPNPVIAGQASTVKFVSDSTGVVNIRKNNCSGQIVQATYGGTKMTNIPISLAGNDCTTGVISVFVDANDVGSPGSHSLVACVGTATSSATTFNISSSGRSGGGGGGGGGGTSGSRSFGSASSNGEDDTNTHSAAPDDPNMCYPADNLRATPLDDGRIKFTWNTITDERVTDLELHWGMTSGNLTKSIELPNVPTMNFPANDLEVGTRYYFTLETLGVLCSKNTSREISVVKGADNKLTSSTPSYSSGSSGSSANTSGGSSNAGIRSETLHGAAPTGNMRTADGSWVSGGVAGGSSGSASGDVGGNAGSGNYSSTAGQHYAAMPPDTAGSGPIALAGGLLLLSGAIAYAVRRRKRVSSS